MGDHNEGGAGLGLDAEEFLPGLLAEAAVQGGKGFVQQEQAGAGG